MIFSCGKTEERKRASRASLEVWHDFFVLWPRSIDVVKGKHRCVWLQTIQRKGTFCQSSYGFWLWDYHIIDRRKNAEQNLPPREDKKRS